MATWLQQYQTLIVGAVGFAGVITTLIVNACLAREAERRKIEHDARVLRVALTEEMKAQRDALKHGAETAQRAKDTSKGPARYDALTPLQRWTDVFDKSIDKLGLLSQEEVAAVLDAYLPLRELSSKIKIFEQRIPPDRRRVEYGDVPEGYALVAHADVEALSEMHSNYIPSFDKAIEKLSETLAKSA